MAMARPFLSSRPGIPWALFALVIAAAVLAPASDPPSGCTPRARRGFLLTVAGLWPVALPRLGVRTVDTATIVVVRRRSQGHRGASSTVRVPWPSPAKEDVLPAGRSRRPEDRGHDAVRRPPLSLLTSLDRISSRFMATPAADKRSELPETPRREEPIAVPGEAWVVLEAMNAAAGRARRRKESQQEGRPDHRRQAVGLEDARRCPVAVPGRTA